MSLKDDDHLETYEADRLALGFVLGKLAFGSLERHVDGMVDVEVGQVVPVLVLEVHQRLVHFHLVQLNVLTRVVRQHEHQVAFLLIERKSAQRTGTPYMSERTMDIHPIEVLSRSGCSQRAGSKPKVTASKLSHIQYFTLSFNLVLPS